MDGKDLVSKLIDVFCSDSESAERVVDAAREYIARQDRSRHPDGRFDNGGRWYPSEEEECECCKSIRSPSRRWPLSLNTHCRTLRHVARLYDVDQGEVREVVRQIRESETK